METKVIIILGTLVFVFCILIDSKINSNVRAEMKGMMLERRRMCGVLKSDLESGEYPYASPYIVASMSDCYIFWERSEP